MINEQIRCKEVRVIGEEGQQLGVMASRDALNMAKDAGVDLVMVSPSANPPVCRIVDYGKFKYEQLRKEKEAKKKQKTVEVKEVRLSPNIDVNDLNTKCNSARKFIDSLAPDYVTGLTLLGGEPFEHSNQQGLLPLLREVRRIYPDLSIWCFTGYLFDKDIVGRMHLVVGNSIELLSEHMPDLNLIYLDPMFPESRKSGLTNKKLQLIRKMEPPCFEEEKLFEAAIKAAPDKVIVKRPLKSDYLAGKSPNYSLNGKAIRYDCYC